MILGLSTSTYTLVHVLISLAGIASGFAVVFGMLAGKRLNGTNVVFLTTTIATSVTGFGFPIHKIGPPHIVGVLSLIALAIALVARYRNHLEGRARKVYAISSIVALYFNVFVLVVQMFQKIAALHALAPTQAEPPFAIAQGAVLLIFVILGVMSTKRFQTLEIA
jgi:hypothetical protein